MRWFRRNDETLNEQLLREAGYAPDGTKPVPPASSKPAVETPTLPSSFDTIFPGVYAPPPPTPQEQPWDVMALADDPKLRAEHYEFATVPDGSLIVDETCDEDLSRLADAIERQLQAPYRAAAFRQHDGSWIVYGRAIEVSTFAADGDALDLSSVSGTTTFAIDGVSTPVTKAPTELVKLGEASGNDYAVHAERVDGDVWEVTADPL